MKVIVEFTEAEAVFVIAALDRHSATAHGQARQLRKMGLDEDDYLLDVQTTTAKHTDSARKRVADVLWPIGDEAVAV